MGLDRCKNRAGFRNITRISSLNVSYPFCQVVDIFLLVESFYSLFNNVWRQTVRTNTMDLYKLQRSRTTNRIEGTVSHDQGPTLDLRLSRHLQSREDLHGRLGQMLKIQQFLSNHQMYNTNFLGNKTCNYKDDSFVYIISRPRLIISSVQE